MMRAPRKNKAPTTVLTAYHTESLRVWVNMNQRIELNDVETSINNMITPNTS